MWWPCKAVNVVVEPQRLGSPSSLAARLNCFRKPRVPCPCHFIHTTHACLADGRTGREGDREPEEIEVYQSWAACAVLIWDYGLARPTNQQQLS